MVASAGSHVERSAQSNLTPGTPATDFPDRDATTHGVPAAFNVVAIRDPTVPVPPVMRIVPLVEVFEAMFQQARIILRGSQGYSQHVASNRSGRLRLLRLRDSMIDR